MLINFNVEKLDKLLYDFYSITGITISIWDAAFQQISYQPKQMPKFCRMIKSTAKGKRACLESDKELCSLCARTETTATHICHAGLIDVAFPIKLKSTIVGYIMFGQISNQSARKMQPTIDSLCRELGLSREELADGYKDLIPYDESYITSAANILKLATRYLWLSEYIDIGYNTLASKIDEYIQKNISEDLSVEALCKAFNISKKRLYEIFHRHFGVPIGEYVYSARINHAKRLLSSTDKPIQQVAYMVGFEDYNYFSNFFKSRVGTSPLKYRKGTQISC